MENDAEQLKSRFMATSRPTNLRDSHGLQPLISEEVISEAGEEKRVIVAKYCYSDAVKPEAGRGETCQVGSLDSESNTSLYDGLAAEEAISLGETCQTTDVCSLDSESNTHQDDGSTGGSQEFEGETHQKTKMDILESESNTYLDDVADSCGSPTVKSKAVKGEPYPRTDMDSERDTCRYDGLATKEANSFCTDIVSQAVIPMAGKVQPSSMESLPSDIVQEILSRVPAESVLECKLVCKKWVTLIRRKNFTDMHLTHQLNHLYSGDDDNDNLAAKVEPCLFFACCVDDPKEYITLLFNGRQ
ncbi:hypothetical protein MKX03_006744, partial [Papaver bracteatum]